VSPDSDDVIAYPIARPNDLTVGDFYRDLQQQGPIPVQLPFGEPCWLATRYHDVKTVYGDKRFGKEIGIGRETPRMWENRIDDPDIMANMDPPRQTRIRRLALVAFAAPKIRTMRDDMTEKVDRYLDEFEAAGHPSDFVATAAWNVPLTVLSGILGVREADIPMFRGWVDQMTGPGSTTEDRHQAQANLAGYVAGLVAERRAHETDDLLSVLVHARDDDDRLTEAELISLYMTLFLGGFETTAAQLTSTVWTLMAHRNLWQELIDDPALLPAALEELWRWIPSFRCGTPMNRWANEDVELSDGVVIPAGRAVVAEHNVANRDESVFPHGWELDFHRENPEPNLSLAWGVHRCLGAHVAHMEVEVMVERLLERFPNLELTIAPEDVKWSETSFLRSAAELPLTW
jgi:cytochrome P450 RapN